MKRSFHKKNKGKGKAPNQNQNQNKQRADISDMHMEIIKLFHAIDEDMSSGGSGGYPSDDSSEMVGICKEDSLVFGSLRIVGKLIINVERLFAARLSELSSSELLQLESEKPLSSSSDPDVRLTANLGL